MTREALLWVVRHGETDWNRERRLQGHTDVALNATGRDQAAELGAELRAELQGAAAPAAVSSDLLRALETARILARTLGLPTVRARRDLRERGFGAAEGRTWAELGAELPQAVAAYKSGGDRDAFPDCEPYARFRTRILRAVAEVAREAERALVVTHGGALRVLLEEALGADKQFIVSNAAVFRFRWRPDRLERVLRLELD